MNEAYSVLVVDDDAASIFLTKMLLKRLGVTKGVITASNGLEALNIIKETPAAQPLPRLIILDIKMPVMDGYTFLDELRKLMHLDLSQTKIVLLSSSRSPQDITKSNNYNVVGYIEKPIKQDELKSLLA